MMIRKICKGILALSALLFPLTFSFLTPPAATQEGISGSTMDTPECISFTACMGGYPGQAIRYGVLTKHP